MDKNNKSIDGFVNSTVDQDLNRSLGFLSRFSIK